MSNDQGLYEGNGTIDPVPLWSGPDGYVLVIHETGFLTTQDGDLIIAERP